MSKEKPEKYADRPDPITWDEFQELCNQAGLGTDDPAQLESDFRMGRALADVTDELVDATERFAPMNSAHEGFAVLKGEMDELWECVREKQGQRDVANMRKEAIQVAAMALRFAADICHDEKGQN